MTHSETHSLGTPMTTCLRWEGGGEGEREGGREGEVGGGGSGDNLVMNLKRSSNTALLSRCL